MKTSIVLTITRPYESDRLVNALTGSIIRPFTLWWVKITPPDRDYRVEYRLDLDGEFIALANQSAMFAKEFPVVLSEYVHGNASKGIAVCVLPVEWIGLRISRRVLPVDVSPFIGPLGGGLDLPLPAVCAYCGVVWGADHGPECVTRNIQPLQEKP